MLERIAHGEIVELRLHRPPANALDRELVLELAAALRTAPAEGAAGIVLSGSPGMFTGGLDLPALVCLGEEELLAAFRAFFELLEAAASCTAPLAVALTGHAPAGGTVIAQLADRRVAARGPFKLGLSEVEVGIVMPESILAALSLRLGWARVAELVTTGRLVEPEEALALGLVDEVVEPEEVVPAAVRWLEAVLRLPREPMLETRRRVRRPLVEAFAGRAEAEAAAFLDRWRRPETQRAVRAMVTRLTGGS